MGSHAWLPGRFLGHIEHLRVTVRHMISRTEVVIVAGNSLTRVAHEIEISPEIAGCDCCVCEVAVLSLGKERVVLVVALCAVTAGI